MFAKRERRLATVMFSDMVGYSKLMSQDEEGAIQARQRMEMAIRQLVPDFGGRIVQFYGDGALSVFPSSLEGVRCAGEIQRVLRQEPEVPVRIGLHQGDIFEEGGNIYGETVNIASRIESFAVPGSVLFSEKIGADLRNHPNCRIEELGAFHLKNIDKPVALCALSGPMLVVPRPEELEGKGRPAQRSVAVLPFLNLSSDPENEYFSDGMSEEILNALAKEPALRVTARTSSFAYKGRAVDMRLIGRELGVETLLEGSVRKAGQRVRITAQLIEAANGYHLFSETYDRTLEDIFAVQDEIAQQIAGLLVETLGLQRAETTLAPASTANIDAYQAYLRGLFYWNRYNPVDVLEAVQFFRKAIELDPAYDKAYAILSFCYSFLGGTGSIPAEEALPPAREAAAKALALDDRQVLAHCAKGLVHIFYDWDLERAEQAFLQAKAINPQDPNFCGTYSLFLRAAGRYRESVEVMEEGVQIDPISLIANTYLIESYLGNRQPEKALDRCDRTLELFPDNLYLRMLKSKALLGMGRTDEAIELAREKADPGHPFFGDLLALRGYLYAHTGDAEHAQRCLVKLEKEAGSQPAASYYARAGSVYYAMDEMDAAFDHLLKAIDARLGGIMLMLNDPTWGRMKEDPRFEEVKKRVRAITNSRKKEPGAPT